MFNRKTKNRRFERKHVLDVKVSSIRRRQIWSRRLGMLMAAAFLLAVAEFLIGRGGEWALEKLVYGNPAFAIHTVDIETDGVLSREQLRSWAGVRLESNLMRLDLNRIKRDLELVPVIESAAVERILPHTLRIRITERVPVAQVFLPSYWNDGRGRPTVYTVDAHGYFMFPVESAQRESQSASKEALPALVGIPLADLRPGRRTALAQVHAALRLLQAFEQSPMAGRVQLRQVDLSSPWLLKVGTDQKSTIVFSLDNPEAQLRRWAAVYQYGLRSNKQIAWMDLSVANNVPVRCQEQATAAETTAPASAPVDPSTRKKHV
jgi:cell division septal protein FtsQ